MATRNNAAGVMQRVHRNVPALKAHQPVHKHSTQCASAKQSAPLPEPNAGAIHIPLLRGRSRRKAIALHRLPALHAGSRCQAVCGVRLKSAQQQTILYAILTLQICRNEPFNTNVFYGSDLW
jgi:hypothetical protein